MWRYTSLSDLINIVKASSLATLLIVSILALSFGLNSFPKSVIFIDYILCTIILASTRTSVRLYFSNIAQIQKFHSSKILKKKVRKRLVVIGAGDSSEKIIREIRDNKNLKYVVVGLLDDDSNKNWSNYSWRPDTWLNR